MTCSAIRRTFMKDLQHLCRTIDASTDGQASIVGIDEMTVKVLLRPKSGYNAHAEFLLTIKCCPTYPKACPDVSFDSPIFHPNIDPSDGAICLSLLSEWRSCYCLVDLVKAVLYVIDHPAFDSPNNRFGALKDPAQLSTNTARVLAGLPVKGRRFPPNRAWLEWARANGCLPTGEEEMEEAEEELRKREDLVQNWGDGVNVSATNMGSEAKSTNATFHALSDTASDSVPSFAKIRYLFDPEEKGIYRDPYESRWTPFEVDSQRILIWHPSSNQKTDAYTVFYFIEFLGTEHHRNELGEHYNTFFIASVLHEYQSHPESRQTSSNCPWYAFLRHSGSLHQNYTSCSSSLNLSDISESNEPIMQTLTADFCPWSSRDGKGMNYLFGSLFFEGNRNGGNFTCFLDEDSDEDSGSQGIGWLFDLCSLEPQNVVMVPDEASDAMVSESTSHCGISYHGDKLIMGSEILLTTEQNTYANELGKESVELTSSVSSTAYRRVRVPYPLVTDCWACRYKYHYIRKSINTGLPFVWKWYFRRTRWSIRFAPQQKVDLSMTGIRIPTWRASSGRMMSDICHFCSKNQNTRNLVLLDPMALSPLSPLLNLMQHHPLPRPTLTGILWLTPLDALSPFYRVPIPDMEEQQDSEDNGHERGDDGYTTLICLRFLAVAALLVNWVAWISRVESYAALGMSRFSPTVISAPVAACLLQPFCLDCGQAPLLDLWPLWLIRRLLTISLRLSQLQFPFRRCRHHQLQYLFPFSDLDEI